MGDDRAESRSCGVWVPAFAGTTNFLSLQIH
jgi:hypothetical protein